MNAATIALQESSAARRAEELFSDQYLRQCRDTDRLFARLMIVQWIAAVVATLVWTPRTWIGAASVLHLHVFAAVVLGGAITVLPVFMARRYAGSPLTRHVIAVAQMLWSALLIHISGGRIETHFHVFGSLAFLAFYRDWRVLVTATAVVAADHFVRGVWWPQSVFGVAIESPYRWMEHAAWVVFEDIVLVRACLRGFREARALSERTALLELTKERVELEVEVRTRELRETNKQLESEVVERKAAEIKQAELHKCMVDMSRQAGMAEVANGVLHNVGNVLNSVNVSAGIVAEKVRNTRVAGLKKLSDLVAEHSPNLAEFLANDQRGQRLPEYLSTLAATLADDRDLVLSEVREMRQNVEHIRDIVSAQQSYGRLSGIAQEIRLDELVDEALKISNASLSRHGVSIAREYAELPPLVADKHKLLQILVNLISNAKQALKECDDIERLMTLRVARSESGLFRVEVADNGVGIPGENLAKIFMHGFTTKPNGNGFGLHVSALAAKELGGTLVANSDGPRRGATFVLELPFTPAAEPARPKERVEACLSPS